MEKGAHGKDENKFEELSYSQQASSLNAEIQYLKKALNAHFRKGKIENKDIESSKSKYKKQILKIVEFLNKE